MIARSLLLAALAFSSASALADIRVADHTHIHDNGVMRMRQLPALDIPAGDTVTLQPGGLHLMLFGLQPPLPAVLPLNLCFSDGQCVAAQAELRSMK